MPKRSRKSEYSDINVALYEWFQLAISRNIYEIAVRLGMPEEFKASNGWLTRWKGRYNISHRIISGESGDVSSQTVDSWFERVPSIVADYDPQNIWNCDETDLFWKALPDKGLAEKRKSCKGGVQVASNCIVFVIGVGASECPPTVIWKSENPRCFKKIKKADLPVWYYSQKKSWMDGVILNSILGRINSKLTRNGRKVLLLMDNAGCHPSDIIGKY